MFKARPPSGNNLEAVPTRRTALPAARLLAVLAALALAAFLSGVLPVQGQTATVLVSNTGLFQSDTGSVLNATFAAVAQEFTTGPVSGGYTLSSFGIRFKAIGDLSTVGSELTVTLNEDSSGEPGNALCTLTDPSSFSANAVNTFTAPTTGTGVCPTLASNQSYFVVMTRANNTTDTISYNVEDFDEDLGEAFQDTGGAEGWSVEKTRMILSSSSNWVGQTSAMLFEVRGAEIVHGVTISESALTIAEGGSGTYTIVLDTEPSADVFIIIGFFPARVDPMPGHPMFTPSTWNTPQTITVRARQDDDAVDDSVEINHTVDQVSAAEYLGLSIDDVDVTVVDDDVPPKVTIKKRVASAPTSAPFRVTITFDRAVTGFEEGDVTGWYPGTHFSFDLTDLREETSGLVYSARVDHILDTPDGRLKVIVGSDAAQSVPGDVGNTPGLRSIKVDTPDPGPEPGGTYVWSATMTAGDSAPGSNATGFIGYGRADTVDDLGEIDSPTFTWQGTDYTVLELIYTPAWATVDLLLSEPLPNNGRGMTLHLGGGRWLRFGDYQNVKMKVVDEADDSRYIWQPVLLGWEQDDSVEVSIKVAGGQAAPQSANTPATGAPTISGAPRVGETLTAGTSGIEDEDGLTGVSFSYQWLVRDGGADTEIPGATASTYTLSDADGGKTFRVRVTFTDDGGSEETLTSAATAAVEPAPNSPATGQPDISGTVQVGETLTANVSGIDDADGLDDAVFSYQWIRNDGTADTHIQDARDSTYVLDADDEGTTIKVRVTFTDDRGHGETLTSSATDTVAGLPPEPLTVSLENEADTHDGETPFTFELRFSEEFNLSYTTLRDHAFTVAGGTVEKAQRMANPSNIHWRITVQPDSNADVTITLPVTTDCTGDGAICTGDGRMLSNSLVFTVSGPGG